MRILYRNLSFKGGAPLSLLEYCKISKNNNEIFVAGSDINFGNEYINNGFNIIQIDSFNIKRPIKNIKVLMKTLHVIKSNKIDLIHVTTISQSAFHKIISILTNIPTIYTIPGGGGKRNIRYLTSVLDSNDIIITYTKENFEELKLNRFYPSRIRLIPNRFDFKAYEVQTDLYKLSLPIKQFSFIGRIHNNNLKAIKNSIIFVGNYSKKNNQKCNLKIAGGGSEEQKLLLKEIIIYFKDVFPNLNIDYIGHTRLVKKIILDSYICFGIGRSIIQPVYMKRISIVINQKGNRILINHKNLNKLKDDNFTGRFFSKDSSPDIAHIMSTDYDKKLEILNYNQNFVINNFDIKFVKDKIKLIYKEAVNSHEKSRFPIFKAIFNFIKIYLFILSRKKEVLHED